MQFDTNTIKDASTLPKGDYLVAMLVAFTLSVYGHSIGTISMFFRSEGQIRNIWKALMKTYISYSFTGLFLNSILMVLWVQVVGTSEFVAPIINIGA